MTKMEWYGWLAILMFALGVVVALLNGSIILSGGDSEDILPASSLCQDYHGVGLTRNEYNAQCTVLSVETMEEAIARIRRDEQ